MLFENLSFGLFEGDRIGLIGPNGAGKSTLIKILCGQEAHDSGEVVCRRGIEIGYVPQSSEFANVPPLQVLLEALEESGLQEHEREVVAKSWLSRVGFTGAEPSADRLSGGWKKRLAIARAMLQEPDIVLLDEPTNHLDLESIVWLETFMEREMPTFVIVSHDRAFLQGATNRTIEISRVYPDGLLSIKGDYAFFMERKEQFLAGQREQERSVASRARRESEWLKTSPKARTTKAQSRIDKSHEIFEEHRGLKQRNRQERAAIAFAGTERQSRKLIACNNLKKSLGGKLLFKNLDLAINPGLRLGLMGPNGCGKTTLMRLIAGEIEPDEGTIKRADDLQIVYFDQHRAALPRGITLRDAMAPNGDFIHYHGQKIHVNGWCKRFLFPPEYLGMSIDRLSGGERARITIARLMLQPADILLLDEPTNDLDIPTLETLEASLSEFPGAVVLISHDRAMLNNLCTQLLAVETGQFYAEYAQWEVKKSAPPPPPAQPKAKATQEDRKERNRLERKIEKLEAQVATLESQLENANQEDLVKLCDQIKLLKQEIDTLFTRWTQL